MLLMSSKANKAPFFFSLNKISILKMATTLAYYPTPPASTSSLSPPTTPTRLTQPFMAKPQGNKRPFKPSTPSSVSSSGDSSRPARRLFYSSSSSISFNGEASSSSLSISSTSSTSLLPAAVLFPPRTPVKKSSFNPSTPSSLKRSPATYNFNMFTQGAFAEEEEAADQKSKALASKGGLFEKTYFNYKTLSSSSSLASGGGYQFNENDAGEPLSSPELPESPMTAYSSEDEDEEMGLDSGSDSFFRTPRRSIAKNASQQALKRSMMTASRSTLRSSFSSSSSIESLSPSFRLRRSLS